MATYHGLNDVQAILLSALVAAVVAIWAIFTQRAISARQTTLEFIRSSESDLETVSARQRFNEAALDPDGLAKWALDENVRTDEARAIRIVLNEQELIAIAIQRGILDDAIFRRYFRSGTMKTWDYAAAYILARRQRTGNQALFHEFEELARWYRGAPNMPHRWFFLRKFI